jgi:hypothetical protein
MPCIIIGSKKIEKEFIFTLASFGLIVVMNLYVTLKDHWDTTFFYLLSMYEGILFLSLVFGNAGHLDDYEKRVLNQKVSLHLFIIQKFEQFEVSLQRDQSRIYKSVY